MDGYIKPFTYRQTFVYLVVEDSVGKLFCFMSIDEYGIKNVKKFVNLLNNS